MRVLLAGGSGAIGRAMIPQLLAAGHEVTATTRTPGSLEGSGADELVADLRDRAGFLAVVADRRFDAVVHEATALRRPPLRHHDLRATDRLRHEGTSTLIAAARRTGATRFVAASSALGYGLRDHGMTPLDESAPFGEAGETPTAESMTALLSLEQQTRAADGISVRYGIVHGPHSGVAPVPRDWLGLLPWVHVDDAARAAVLALDRGTPGSAYNVVDDAPASWREVMEHRAVQRGTRRPLVLREGMWRTVAPYLAEVVTATAMRVSNESARSELGWIPAVPSYRARPVVGASN